MVAASQLKVVPDIPADLMKHYLKQSVLAVDCEMQGLRLGRDQVCLIQLCDDNGAVCLVRPDPPTAPPNLKRVLTHAGTTKIFHYALSDVTFLSKSMGIEVAPFRCTKVMSKLARTYTEQHGLKHLVAEFLGHEMEKVSQTSNWAAADLSPAQLQYAANDVLYLLKVYDSLKQMLAERGPLPTGITPEALNERSQACLPAIVELILNGYGDRDQGWETSLFSH